MRVAILKTGALGDVIRTTAILGGLKKKYPALHVSWITALSAKPLVEHHPLVNRVYDWQAPDLWSQQEFDWVISLEDDRAACGLATKLKTRRFTGAFEDKTGELRYTADLEAWFGMGMLRPAHQGGLPQANILKRQNRLSHGQIFFEGLELPGPVLKPAIRIPRKQFQGARNLLSQMGGFPAERPLVGLNTGGGARWKYKSWGDRQTAQLAAKLHDTSGASILLLGGALEAERNERILRDSSRPFIKAAPCDLDLLTFAALISQLDLLASSDSLAMHMGIAFEKPTIAFFGPTSDAEIDVFGLGEKVVTPLSCKRCYLPDCGVQPHCMEAIDVETMFNAISRWIPARKALVA